MKIEQKSKLGILKKDFIDSVKKCFFFSELFERKVLRRILVVVVVCVAMAYGTLFCRSNFLQAAESADGLNQPAPNEAYPYYSRHRSLQQLKNFHPPNPSHNPLPPTYLYFYLKLCKTILNLVYIKNCHEN